MADNMTIGPVLAIGGNQVQMTTKGKIQVTNAKGKIKTLSQDEFKKQLVKNADKLEAGENFEFKKNNKIGSFLKIATATAAVASAVIYRKEIGKYMKDFSWKKLGQDIKNLFIGTKKKIAGLFGFKKEPKMRTVFDGEFAGRSAKDSAAKETAKETRKIVNETLAKTAHYDANAFEARMAQVDLAHASRQKELEEVFALPKVDPKMREKWLQFHPETTA